MLNPGVVLHRSADGEHQVAGYDVALRDTSDDDYLCVMSHFPVMLQGQFREEEIMFLGVPSPSTFFRGDTLLTPEASLYSHESLVSVFRFCIMVGIPAYPCTDFT